MWKGNNATGATCCILASSNRTPIASAWAIVADACQFFSLISSARFYWLGFQSLGIKISAGESRIDVPRDSSPRSMCVAQTSSLYQTSHPSSSILVRCVRLLLLLIRCHLRAVLFAWYSAMRYWLATGRPAQPSVRSPRIDALEGWK